MTSTLQQAFIAWQKNDSSQNYHMILEEVGKLVEADALVLINGLPMYDKENRVDPMGINGPDGLFYIIVFADEQALEHAGFEKPNPYRASIRALIRSMWMNRNCGGICINYALGEKVPLIDKKNLVHMWDSSVEENK